MNRSWNPSRVENPVPPGVTGDLKLEASQTTRRKKTHLYFESNGLLQCVKFSGFGIKLGIFYKYVILDIFWSAPNTTSTTNTMGCWKSRVYGNRIIWVQLLTFPLTQGCMTLKNLCNLSKPSVLASENGIFLKIIGNLQKNIGKTLNIVFCT